MGAGLPAMQATRHIRQTQLMPSQASQLPQGNASASETRSATRPPRFVFDFDLRRPVKHAGRNSAWIWGMPSLGEVPSVGARALCLLWGFSKVSRCKSGTNSGRYRRNGYVPHQTTTPQNSDQKNKPPQPSKPPLSPVAAHLPPASCAPSPANTPLQPTSTTAGEHWSSTPAAPAPPKKS